MPLPPEKDPTGRFQRPIFDNSIDFWLWAFLLFGAIPVLAIALVIRLLGINIPQFP
jgi:hypothetical protein